ncbi:Heavy metal transport/detoxification superfamily protein [Raphanus sativus]|uniref:Heavy metal-associated isoprenylated plant protein 16-like n=1 Tax=Raphanus sativus TaxID=3726 RepID=A0A6J0NAI6_RAPSA|nr:heavy metal-associated isoprenylated plant protein 16-like [Raphanus sativus]KAJ4899591.1 Heavy metal transport/detoxification superfamily protein [Raphanus sativus]
MKQKILIRVTMTDDKTRAKAMKTAAQFEGDHRNKIEVTGVEVNMICLTNTLRKKVAFAELVSVNKVEPPKKPEDNKKKDDKKPDEKKPDEKKADEKKTEEKKTEEKKAEPCCCNPCYPPWPYRYGVPSSFPHSCDPYGHNFRDYTGELFYNYGPNWRFI